MRKSSHPKRKSKPTREVFKFWEPDPTNQIICNNIDEGDESHQQYLQSVIAESSVTVAPTMHGPIRRTLVNESWRQRNKGPYKCYLQRCPDANSTSNLKEESTNAASDYEFKSQLDIRNSHSVFRFSLVSDADDVEAEYQYCRQRALVYEEITPNLSSNVQNCPGSSQSVFQFSAASEDEDDEAEYQHYRQRALVSLYCPLLEQQNITDTPVSYTHLTLPTIYSV